MADRDNDKDSIPALQQHIAMLEEKNGDLIARIRELSDENRAYEALTRALLDKTPFGIAIFDTNQRLVQLNHSAESILGLQRVTAIGRSCQRIFNCLIEHENQCPIPGRHDTLDRVETNCSVNGCTDKTLLRSVVQIPSRDENVLVEAFIDISEIKLAQQEIENTNRIKDGFLSRISHELRTPLNSILGFAELLRESALQKQMEGADEVLFLESILRSGKELLRMVDEILDITRITAKRMTLDEYETDIASVLQSVIRKVELELSDNGNRVSFKCQGITTMLIDPFRLHQVLYHLVHNACKYTMQGDVNINVKGDDNMVLFGISDTGPGIDPAHVQRIFQEFEQADTGNTRQFNGAGLGLSLCYQICRLMDGEISVESQPGKGSLFKLKLPNIKRDKVAV
ncbi:MAG: ATP-binding protein [Gammaproteobacteria bacterium]|nr:ATP-binding protein [Gammaproteobacteria bacterium]